MTLLFLAGFSLSLLICYLYISTRFGSLRQKGLLILKQAEKEAEKERHAVEIQLQEHKALLQKEEAKLKFQKEQQAVFHKQLQQEQEHLRKDRSNLEKDKSALFEKSKLLEKSHNDALSSLEKISHLSHKEAKLELLHSVEKEIENELLQKKKELLEHSPIEAQKILFSAIERLSQGSTKEHSLTEISLSSNLIPRIIGKGGRNIQMLEKLLDVTLTVEQTSLIISSHNPKNRYLASLTIQSLLETEKITPVIIRDTLEKVSQQIEKEMIEEGKKACKKIGLTPFPEKLSALLGSLLFRSSVGQNTLKHSIEVAELMAIVASEMNLDADTAKKMGLLHDIGKALSPEWGATHALAGKKFLEQFDLHPTIINGVSSHHQDEKAQSLEARLLPICDKISAQPLGVRKQSDPTFLSIVQECEEIAKSVPKVSSAWAHYAGSHVEVLVRADCEQESLYENLRSALSALQTKLPITITLLST